LLVVIVGNPLQVPPNEQHFVSSYCW
jgi:hypothetical protein